MKKLLFIALLCMSLSALLVACGSNDNIEADINTESDAKANTAINTEEDINKGEETSTEETKLPE